MAENIKGLTVVLGADTTALGKALADVNKRSKDIQKELKEVDNLLKLDPTNVELIAQKQKLLTDAVGNTTEKLDRLKKVQSQIDEQFQKGEISEGQYRKFEREVISTEQALGKLKTELNAVSRSADASASDMTKLENDLDGAGQEAKKLAKETDKAEKSLKDVGDTSEKAGGKVKAGIGMMAAAAGAAAGAIGGLVASSAELNQDLARLATNAYNADYSMEGIEEQFKKVAAVSGEADSAVETLSNLMATDFNQNQLAEAINHINGAAIRFSDTLKTEGIADGLQETFASGKAIGQFGELLERSGVDIDKFNEGLAEAQKQGTHTSYVLEELSKLELDFTYDQYLERNKAQAEYNAAQVELQLSLAKLGETLMPLVTMAMEFGKAIVDWSAQAIEAAKNFDLFSSGILENLPQMFEAGVKFIENLISGIVSNLPQIVETVVSVITTWIDNAAKMYPMILEAGVSIIIALIEGIIDSLPLIIESILTVVTTLLDKLVELLPTILDAGIDILMALIDGIVDALPSLIKTVIDLVFKVIDTIIKNLPKILEAGIEILLALIEGIIEVLPDLVEGIITVVLKIIEVILNNLPMIIESGIEILFALIDGLMQAIPQLVAAIPKIVKAIFDAFDNVKWSDIGKNIMDGLIKGLNAMIDRVKEAARNIAKTVSNGIKNVLDINSPSKVTEQLGEWTGEGLVEGMRNTVASISQQANKLATAAIPQVQQTSSTSAAQINLAGFMSGAIFNVRSEHDIKAIAREIFNLQQSAMRGAGI